MIERLNTSEILRYLGYPTQKAPDAETTRLIQQCTAQLLQTVRPKYLAAQFQLDRNESMLFLSDAKLSLPGKAIVKHLAGCEKCILMAATLGIEADRLIRKAQLCSMTEGLVMDACATAFIEAVCDDAEAEIHAQYGSCNFRFSPGYGDLPITLQRDILTLLQAEKKIGLHANAANLLIPGKSVTAILGVTDRVQKPKNKCNLCQNKERCGFCRHGNEE